MDNAIQKLRHSKHDAVILLTGVTTALAKPNRPTEQVIIGTAFILFDENAKKREQAINWFVKRGKKDAIAPLIQALRFVQTVQDALHAALKKLSSANPGPRWHDWILWQQAHPDIKPFKGYDVFKAELMARIDSNFRVFLYPNIAHEIRLEEIAWGDVRAYRTKGQN